VYRGMTPKDGRAGDATDRDIPAGTTDALPFCDFISFCAHLPSRSFHPTPAPQTAFLPFGARFIHHDRAKKGKVAGEGKILKILFSRGEKGGRHGQAAKKPLQ
jgi:hypothetical protein